MGDEGSGSRSPSEAIPIKKIIGVSASLERLEESATDVVESGLIAHDAFMDHLKDVSAEWKVAEEGGGLGGSMRVMLKKVKVEAGTSVRGEGGTGGVRSWTPREKKEVCLRYVLGGNIAKRKKEDVGRKARSRIPSVPIPPSGDPHPPPYHLYKSIRYLNHFCACLPLPSITFIKASTTLSITPSPPSHPPSSLLNAGLPVTPVVLLPDSPPPVCLLSYSRQERVELLSYWRTSLKIQMKRMGELKIVIASL